MLGGKFGWKLGEKLIFCERLGGRIVEKFVGRSNGFLTVNL